MPITFPRSSSPVASPSLSSQSSSSSLSPTTEVDDSLPLSDLIFAGEQSRLRRRGAVYHPPSATHRTRRRTSSASSQDSAATTSSSGYALFCGGPPSNLPSHIENDDDSPPFTPALLPWSGSPSHQSPKKPRTQISNGCGALICTGAIPDTSINVFVSQSQRPFEDSLLLPIDSRYVNDSEIEFPEKLGSSTNCSCERSAIACAQCGNIVGTRYLSCGQSGQQDVFHDVPNATAPVIDDMSYYRPGGQPSRGRGSSRRPTSPGDDPDHVQDSVSASSTPTIRPDTLKSPPDCIYSFLPSHVTSYPSYEFTESPLRRGFAAFDRDRAILERSSALRGPRAFLQRGPGNHPDMPILRYPETGSLDHISADSGGYMLTSVWPVRTFDLSSRSPPSPIMDSNVDLPSISSGSSPAGPSDSEPQTLATSTPTNRSPGVSREDLTSLPGGLYGRPIYPPTPHSIASVSQSSPSPEDSPRIVPLPPHPRPASPPQPRYRTDFALEPVRFSPRREVPPAPRIPHLEPNAQFISSHAVPSESLEDGDEADDTQSLPDLIPGISWISTSAPERNGAQTQQPTSPPMETIQETSEESSQDDRNRSLEYFFQIFLRLRQDGALAHETFPARISVRDWSARTEDSPSLIGDSSRTAERDQNQEGEEDKEWWHGLDLDENGDPRPRPSQNLFNR